jgi:hypothetical protein
VAAAPCGVLSGGAAMSKDLPVQWPGKAYSEDGLDLGEPIQRLLVDLHVLEKDGEQAGLLRTPASVQVITAGATALAKVWPGVLTVLGGAAGITALVKGLGYRSSEPLVAATFTIAAAVCLSTALLAVAVIVRADVRARADASAAQYRARAEVTAALLASSQYNVPPAPPLPAPALNYMLMTKDGTWHPVREFHQTPKGVVARLCDQQPDVPMSDVKGLTPTTVWSANGHPST